MVVRHWIETIKRKDAWLKIAEYYLPHGPICPDCGQPVQSKKALDDYYAAKRVWCHVCKRQFNPLIGTPIADTSWKPEEFVHLVLLSMPHYSPAEIAQCLGKSLWAVREMLAKLGNYEPQGGPR